MKMIAFFSLVFCIYVGFNQAVADEINAAMLELQGAKGQQIDAVQLDASAHIEINAITARVTMNQRFKNNTQEWAHGRYLFPLPENAAIDSLIMQIGERKITGKIREKQEAEELFKQAKEQGKQASLLEQQRPNMFTSRIANIAPGSEIQIEISYLQSLDYDGEGYSLHLPTTITPRYISPEARTTQTASIKSPTIIDETETRNRISITARIDAGFMLETITSRSHEITWQYTGENYQVRLSEDNVAMDKDFQLRWTLNPIDQPEVVLFSEEVDGKTYATLMMMPPQEVPSNYQLPREVIFIIDRSGSMEGAPMRQAKLALSDALKRLTPTDMFNIIEFDDETSSLFSQSRLATAEYLKQGEEFTMKLFADGGTDMVPSLTKALLSPQQSGYLRQVIFLTDGSIGYERSLLKLIHDNLGEARLFMVGIGSAPNSYFMRKSAQFGRGLYMQINKLDEVQQRMSRLYQQLETPLVRDIEVTWPKSFKAESYPSLVPDLYLGQPIVVHARVEKLDEAIEVSGTMSDMAWSRKITPDEIENQNEIAKLWARFKIEELMDLIREGEEESTLKPEITALALEHQIVSDYTSFIAIEEVPARSFSESAKDHDLPNLLPAGVLSPYPQGGTSARFTFWLALLLLITSLLLWKYQPKTHLRESS